MRQLAALGMTSLILVACRGETHDEDASAPDADPVDVTGWVDAPVELLDASEDGGPQDCLEGVERAPVDQELTERDGVIGGPFVRGNDEAVLIVDGSAIYLASAADGTVSLVVPIPVPDPSFRFCDAERFGDEWHVVGTTENDGWRIVIDRSGLRRVGSFTSPRMDCVQTLFHDDELALLGIPPIVAPGDPAHVQVVRVDATMHATIAPFEGSGTSNHILGKTSDGVIIHAADRIAVPGDDGSFRAYVVRLSETGLETEQIPHSDAFRFGEHPSHIHASATTLLAGVRRSGTSGDPWSEVMLEWRTEGSSASWSSSQRGVAEVIGIHGELPLQRVLVANVVFGDDQIMLGVASAAGALRGGLQVIANRSVSFHSWDRAEHAMSLASRRGGRMEIATWRCRP